MLREIVGSIEVARHRKLDGEQFIKVWTELYAGNYMTSSSYTEETISKFLGLNNLHLSHALAINEIRSIDILQIGMRKGDSLFSDLYQLSDTYKSIPDGYEFYIERKVGEEA